MGCDRKVEIRFILWIARKVNYVRDVLVYRGYRENTLQVVLDNGRGQVRKVRRYLGPS